MTIFAICMTALSFFLLGFIIGRKEKPSGKTVNILKSNKGKKVVTQGFRNFLSYDGTEQT